MSALQSLAIPAAALVAAAAAALALLPTLLAPKKPSPPTTPERGDPADRIVLHSAPAAPGVPTASPFDLKLRSYLHLAGLEYDTVKGSPLASPKGYVPFISHGKNVIGDSELIIGYLERTYPAAKWKNALRWDQMDESQRTASDAAVRITEDSFYRAFLYYRWLWSDANFGHVASYVLASDPVAGSVPSFLRPLAYTMARRGVVDGIKARGMLAHSEADILKIAGRDLDALAGLLTGKKFLGGDVPCEGDCSVFGMLENVHHGPWESPLRGEVRKRPALVAFLDRMRAAAFPDFVSAEK
ncbi:hypothetical protein DFJ74DRAFT_772204 [Hyaloraphidium curvatum]|nr:hypothetical protein DFJ74DRAFT_772204 [Hyaloraphidium curvatum]